MTLGSWFSFIRGSGMQLGAKGFAVGFLYTVVGLLLAFVTHVIVYVRNRNAQRLVMFISSWAVQMIFVGILVAFLVS